MKRSWLRKILFLLLVVLIVVPILFPFVWMLASSFKTQVDIVAWPPRLVFTPTLQNYVRVFKEQNFLKYFINSSIIGISAVFFSLLMGLPAAYSIARYQQKRLSMFILVARLMPGISFLMPWYILFSRLK